MQDGYLIANLRKKLNLNQIEIAMLLKISPSTYKLYETNQRIMRLSELNVLSNLFNVSLNSLLGITKDTSSYNEATTVNYKILKYNLKMLRKKANISQKDLAKDFKMSLNSISNFETEPRHIRVDFLYNIAKKFDVSIDFICGKTLEKEIAR